MAPEVIEAFAHVPDVGTHFVDARPVGRTVLRGLAGRGIDARFEQSIEDRMERRRVERAARDLVPVEGVEMAEVEDQAMAIGDRPFVKRRFGYESEQRVGVVARLLQFAAQVRIVHVGIFSGNRALGASPGITRFRGMRLAVSSTCGPDSRPCCGHAVLALRRSPHPLFSDSRRDLRGDVIAGAVVSLLRFCQRR